MSNIENFDIKSHITESIVEVFDTMVSMEIEHTDSEPQIAADTSRVVAGVNFAGNIAGMLNIQVSTDFARQMTANMLDMEPEELDGDGEIKDLLSEISNIVGGNLKSALNDADLACVLSAPSMTYGGDFTIKSLKMERFERFVFMNQQDWVVVEVGIKTQQGAEDGEGLADMDTLGRLQNVDAEKVNAIDINAKVAEEPPEPNASDSESVSQSTSTPSCPKRAIQNQRNRLTSPRRNRQRTHFQHKGKFLLPRKMSTSVYCSISRWRLKSNWAAQKYRFRNCSTCHRGLPSN